MAVIMMMLVITHDGSYDNGDHDENFDDQLSMTPTSSSPVSGLKK